MRNYWIELVENFQGTESWQAICRRDEQEAEGWALRWNETDPRELLEEELIGGYRLPSYMLYARPPP